MGRLLKDKMNSKKKFILFIVFIAFSLLMGIFSGYLGFNTTSLESFVSINHSLAVFLYTLIFTVLASFSFSVSVMNGFGVLIFSWYEVVICATIGIMISSTIHFYISRKLGRDYVRSYLEKRGGAMEKFDEIVEKDTFKTIFILSAIYFVPPTLPNILGGVIKINYKKYFIATFLGNIPNTFFTVYLINGFLYSNAFQIYFSIAGLIITTLAAIYFYNGEIKHILKLSFPWISNKTN
jgi:uncharacterized membrane protein YdjX (TVP38/TMEM64 family)